MVTSFIVLVVYTEGVRVTKEIVNRIIKKKIEKQNYGTIMVIVTYLIRIDCTLLFGNQVSRMLTGGSLLANSTSS